MKKTLASTLGLLACLCLALPAFAAPEADKVPAGNTEMPKVASDQSTVVHKKMGDVTFHTFVGPAEKARFSNTVVEGPEGLLLIDVLQTPDESKDLHDYVKSLKKPVKGIVLTKGGPANWDYLALYEEDIPVFATTSTFNAMKDKAPATKRQVKELPDGEYAMNGTHMNVRHPLRTMCSDAKLVTFPKEKTAMVNGLGCSGVHMPMANPTARNVVLKELIDADYVWIIPSNGMPGGQEVLQHAGEYNAELSKAIASGKSAKQVKETLMQAYPEWAAEEVLDISIPKAMRPVEKK